MRLLAVVTLAWWLTLPGVALAQEAAESLDQRINDAVLPITDKVVEIVFYSIPIGGSELPLIVVWLIAGAIFFTFYFGFINIRGFRRSSSSACCRW